MSKQKAKEGKEPQMEEMAKEPISPSQGGMDPERAIKIIESALNHANLKGSFTLEESTAIFQAISTLKS